MNYRHGTRRSRARQTDVRWIQSARGKERKHSMKTLIFQNKWPRDGKARATTPSTLPRVLLQL